MPDDFVLIKGGAFQNKHSGYYDKHITLSDFFIDRYEVTQKEWAAVMGNNPSTFKGDQLPVETVSWYDCIVYCNKRSIKEGLTPYYNIDSVHKDAKNTNTLDDVKWMVTINMDVDGYRLPTEAEWEFAAGGGVVSRNYKYSGGDNVDDVAWYWKNAGDKYLTGAWSWPVLEKNHNKAKPVGGRRANELGIYDMSGNVREWCMNWNEDASAGEGPGKVWKGGGWMGSDFCCEPAFRASLEANGKGPDQGLRVCRSK
jgi:formylglycine-generating enzyme required for sulfatase activity